MKGEIKLENGKLWGIDTITRPDDVDFEYNDPVADLKSEFTVANLRVKYECGQGHCNLFSKNYLYIKQKK